MAKGRGDLAQPRGRRILLLKSATGGLANFFKCVETEETDIFCLLFFILTTTTTTTTSYYYYYYFYYY